VSESYKVKLLYSEEEVRKKVSHIASEISSDYRGKSPLFLGVLKGSFLFLADLLRSLDGLDPLVDFLRVSSYGEGTSPRRNPAYGEILSVSPEGKDVIIVEDIIDTGRSLHYLIKHIERESPATLRVCALIDKRERREVAVPVHYRGFLLERGFVVGYGMDFSEKFRNIKSVCLLEKKGKE